MHVHRPSFQELIADIYSAALEPERWPSVVRSLAQRHGAHVGVLFTPQQGMQDRFLFAEHGIDPAITRSYSDYWHQHDAWRIAGSRGGKLRSTTVCLGESLIADDELIRTPFYNELLTAMDVRHLITAVLFDENDQLLVPQTHLSLMRASDRGLFGSETREELQALAPHLRCAVRAHWSLQREHAMLLLRDVALDAQPMPIFWLSPTGRVLLANAAARELLESGTVLRSRNDRLIAFGAPASQPFSDALAQACTGTSVTVALKLESYPVVRLLPPRQGAPDGRTVFGVLMQIESAAPLRDRKAIDSLATLYRLTPTEIDVLLRLADGAIPSEIANELHVSISTIRTHLKSLYSKTGARRQADLVRLAIRFSLHREVSDATNRRRQAKGSIRGSRLPAG